MFRTKRMKIVTYLYADFLICYGKNTNHLLKHTHFLKNELFSHDGNISGPKMKHFNTLPYPIIYRMLVIETKKIILTQSGSCTPFVESNIPFAAVLISTSLVMILCTSFNSGWLLTASSFLHCSVVNPSSVVCSGVRRRFLS